MIYLYHWLLVRLYTATWYITLRPRQNGCHFADNIFKCIFLNENIRISIKISLKFVPKGSINNIPALFQIIARRDRSTSHYLNQWWTILTTHICVTQPQWDIGLHYNVSWLYLECKSMNPWNFNFTNIGDTSVCNQEFIWSMSFSMT